MRLPDTQASDRPVGVPAWRWILGGSLAGGLGWGIRGQYGHETGAMIAGLLVSLILVRLAGTGLTAAAAFRAVAAGTVGFGFGGSMTYGQTVGLTHDSELVGHHAALAWGLVGLAIKGGIWIGYGGLLLGWGLGGARPRPGRAAALWIALLGVCATGIWLLNEPFDPANRLLPRIYFSDSWAWEPGAALRPRREVWGGLGLGLAALLAVARGCRAHSLAFRLGVWGILGGALGFPAGQALQSFHAWHPDLFAAGPAAAADRFVNWWNWMETTFGLVMGAVVGLGLWRNRGLVGTTGPAPTEASLPPSVEALLLPLHLALLTAVEFGSIPWVDRLYDFGLLLGFLPVLLIAGGRAAPTLLALPATLLPIAGKTLLRRLPASEGVHSLPGIAVAAILPLAAMGATCWLAAGWLRDIRTGRSPLPGLTRAVTWMAWTFFTLNFAIFDFPWPWAAWTVRTPNALLFLLCALSLTWLARTGVGTPTVAHEEHPAEATP